MKELIDFLEKKGFTKQANSLKNGATTLNLNLNIGDIGVKELAASLKTNTTLTSLNFDYNGIRDVEVKEIEERICYNKEKKIPLLLCSYFKSNMDANIEFKVLTANKFYQLVNKQLLKESLREQGINDVESELKKVDDLIKRKAFTIADVCKDMQPDKVAPGELHISNLPTEIMDNILAYVGDTPWG